MTCFIIKSNDLSLLAILNSSLIKYLMELFAISRRGGYLEYKVQYIEKLPIKQFSNNFQIGKLVTLMFEYNSLYVGIKNQFLDLLKSKFTGFCFNKKLENWQFLSSEDFFSELKKQKITLSLSEHSELLQYFEKQKSDSLAIKKQLLSTDKEIDRLVYELYDLNEEEIKVVEAVNS